MASTQRLLLQALLMGMGNAVRRNDESAADRYHRRLTLIGRHFDTNPLVSDALDDAREGMKRIKEGKKHQEDMLKKQQEEANKNANANVTATPAAKVSKRSRP